MTLPEPQLCDLKPRAGDPLYDGCRRCGHIINQHSMIRGCTLCELLVMAYRTEQACRKTSQSGILSWIHLRNAN